MSHQGSASGESGDQHFIIDEDWKSKVEEEKETEETPETEGDEAPGEIPLPPASLASLITAMAGQAVAAMGQIPDPMTGKTLVQVEQAKYFIDTLGMLEEKTEGNRTDEESAMLTQVLHQLRMMYVAAEDVSVEPQSNPEA